MTRSPARQPWCTVSLDVLMAGGLGSADLKGGAVLMSLSRVFMPPCYVEILWNNLPLFSLDG